MSSMWRKLKEEDFQLQDKKGIEMELKERISRKVKEMDKIVNQEAIPNMQEIHKDIVVHNQGEQTLASQTQALEGYDSIPQMNVSLKQAKDRIKELQDFIRYMMVSGIDYGIIPGCEKPALFKAGAEKLCDIYGFSRTLEVTNRIEDWQNGFFHYEIKVIIWNKKTGMIEAEGVGSCNTKEKKYHTSDPYNIINTILKMAKKRALIDAVLSATRTSGIFSQDLDVWKENLENRQE